MATDALLKAGRPHTSYARACYIGRKYSSPFIASWFYW